MYKIGEFSKLCKVSVNTLRYYDNENLLKPDYIDKFTGYRYYTGEKLKYFNLLIALKDAGFSLDEIKSIMLSSEDIDKAIDKKELELKNDISNLNTRLSRLAIIRKSLQGGISLLNVIVKEGNFVNMATVRRVIASREEITMIIDEISAYLKSKNIQVGNINLVINYETEYIQSNLDLEIGVSYVGKLPKDCPYTDYLFDVKEKMASVVCNCSEIENGYCSLHQYIEEQRYQIIGTFYEFYHNDKTVEILVPICKLSDNKKTPKNDNINLTFEDDESVVGKWEVIDLLPCKEMFNKDKTKYTGHKKFKEIYFLPDGEWYWCFGWTKGYLLSSFGYPESKGQNAYSIENIEGQNYMFIEMKLSEYFMYNGRPEIWVLKQIDSISYQKNDIKIKDNTDFPFDADNTVYGRWEVYDLIERIEDFDPDVSRFPKEALYWKSVEFVQDGNCKVSYGDNKTYGKPYYSWTKNYVLASSVAQRYELIRIKGCDYLFIEWKSGDYTFGGRKPVYYVFRREE